MKLKKWIIRLAFCVVLLLSLFAINNILEYKSPHGINQARAFYHQPKNSIDILALGTSHIHCGINVGELWDDYGFAAYDFSAAEQPVWTTYYYLQEAYKYQSPKVVILDLFGLARFNEEYHYTWMEESIYGLKFSGNKYEMLKASMEPELVKKYIPSFFTEHNRYVDLNKEDFKNIFGNHNDKLNFKGYTPAFNRYDQTQPFGGWEELQQYELSDKTKEYLKKIIDLCNEHNSKLMLIVIPYNMDERDNIAYKEIEKIAEEENVEFYNFCDEIDDIKIDITKDYNDHTHLNYWGSVKFSNYLGKMIQEKNIVPDRRGNEKYESWQINADNVRHDFEE